MLDEVNYEMIPQRSVVRYIENQKHNSVEYFSQLYPSCKLDSDLTDYYTHNAEYTVKQNLDDVWNAYKLASPEEIWNGRVVSFGIMYSRKDDEVVYQNCSYGGLEVGQIIYVNLRFLKGIYNLATAFEVVKIDDKNKVIQFSYIDGGKSKGLQTIYFNSTGKGFTKISHHTDYKSDSRFRDRFLYGPFHKKCINQFHHNVKRFIFSLAKS